MSNIVTNIKNDDISIILCGQAGLGIQSVEYLLTRILKLSGFNVFATKEYMSRVRGGANSTEIRVSSNRVSSFVNRIDILVPLNKGAIEHVAERISPETIVLSEKDNLSDNFGRNKYRFIEVPFTKIATDIGNKIYSNVVAVGTLCSLFGIESKVVIDYVRSFFAAKSDDIIKKNIEAAEAGYKKGISLINSDQIKININKASSVKDDILLNGAEAVGLGALAGGCNFVSSYPMSPSTAVLVFLAKHSNDFGVIVEQAEDEIAAMNMCIGAWYAGARAMVTTSGGGFALMIEGLSLAGMLESPIVIHLAQRPGPATGLPTRTEQADLELALYAGHGEFGRIILAPGKIEDGLYLTNKAFDLADKYQVPVFILTDQYFIDSYYNIPALGLQDKAIENYTVETKKDYIRYNFSDNGISARGIPGHGEGLVVVDSDEHDQQGHITENLDIRVKMVDKRLKKMELVKDEIIAPEQIGSDDYKTLIICWGSTYNVVTEAVKTLNKNDLAVLHFKQVYPIHDSIFDYIQKAQRIVIVENNATSQFGKLLKLKTGIDIEHKILKYNGLCFSVEELTDRLEEILG